MTYIDYSDTKDINDLFVGRKIVSADKESGLLTLDNGVKVTVVPNDGGCSCSAGDYSLSYLNSFDNAITRVSVEMDYEASETVYTIFVYAEGVASDGYAVAAVEGDDGNGYYGTGFSLAVTIEK